MCEVRLVEFRESFEKVVELDLVSSRAPTELLSVYLEEIISGGCAAVVPEHVNSVVLALLADKVVNLAENGNSFTSRKSWVDVDIDNRQAADVVASHHRNTMSPERDKNIVFRILRKSRQKTSPMDKTHSSRPCVATGFPTKSEFRAQLLLNNPGVASSPMGLLKSNKVAPHAKGVNKIRFFNSTLQVKTEKAITIKGHP